MNDDTATLAAQPMTDTIYIVKGGDSLSKIAQHFYGRPDLYTVIAQRNNLDPKAILYIGTKLVIPPINSPTQLQEVETTAQKYADYYQTTAPQSPGGSVPVEYNGQTIETVTTTATRLPTWWQDWRVWVAVGGVAFVVWYVAKKK